MPPRRRAPAPISIDVEAVRRKLAEGKIVRVGISRSAQFPDGGVGRVRRVGDPTVDGEEFVQVELSLNGTKDTLPFTPADLTPATRAEAAVAGGTMLVAVTPTAATKQPVRGPDPRRAAPISTVQETDSLFGGAIPTATTPTTTSRSKIDVTSNVPAASSTAAALNGATPPGVPPTSVAPPAAKPKATRGSAKRTPAVAITIATTDTEPPQWRIEAKVGARVVLRSGSVTPARVWELVVMLDDPTLIRAVGTVLDDQRKAAQARADALAAELAMVRAELEALPDARS